MKIILNKIILGLLFFSLIANAQQIKAKIDTAYLKVGQPLHYTLQVTALKNDKVVLPKKETLFNPHLEFLSLKTDTVYKNEKAIYTQHWSLAGYDEGKYTIQSIGMQLNNEIKSTPTFALEILPTPIDTINQKMFGIKGIMKEQYNWWDYFQKYWLYGAAILFLLLIIGLAVFMYFSEKNKAEKNKQNLGPYEEAIKGLKELDQKKYLQNNQDNLYYTKLIEITKHYFGRRLAFSSSELLSDQFLDILKAKDTLTIQDLDRSKIFLQDADLVKFGKYNLSDNKHIEYRKFVEELIEKTKPILDEDDLRAI